MAETSFDIIIIGSGPGGYVTAIRAAQLGFKTAIVESKYLGGICLNWAASDQGAAALGGDLPLHAAAKEFGCPRGRSTTTRAHRQALARHIEAAQRRRRLSNEKNKISVIWGEAFIDAPGEVTVKPSKSVAPKGVLGAGTYQGKHIIIATGARPSVLPGIEPDKKLVWTYFEAMVPDRMPKSLLIVGSGAIGIEFASFYRTLGADVTVVEVLPQILPIEDAEIAGLARKSFEKQGIKI